MTKLQIKIHERMSKRKESAAEAATASNPWHPTHKWFIENHEKKNTL